MEGVSDYQFSESICFPPIASGEASLNWCSSGHLKPACWAAWLDPALRTTGRAGSRNGPAGSCGWPVTRSPHSRTRPRRTRRSSRSGTTPASRSATRPRSARCSPWCTPKPDVVELAEADRASRCGRSRTDLFLDAEVFAQLELGGRRTRSTTVRAGCSTRRCATSAGPASTATSRVRERVRALDQRLTDLGQAFARNIRDGRRTTLVPASALDGLPDGLRGRPRARRRRTGGDHHGVPGHCYPFLTFSRDAEARREVAGELLRPRLAGERRGARASCSRPRAREGDAARLRRAGPTTTPRSR